MNFNTGDHVRVNGSIISADFRGLTCSGLAIVELHVFGKHIIRQYPMWMISPAG